MSVRTAAQHSAVDSSTRRSEVAGESADALSPASATYLRSAAAVAVNAKVASLHELLTDQKKRYENDVITLRKQLEHALQAHNSLLATHRQQLSGGTAAASETSRAVSANGDASATSTAALVASFQKQIAVLQEQQRGAREQREDADRELSQLRSRCAELAARCEVRDQQVADAEAKIEQLEERLRKPAVEPPAATTAGIAAQSTAVARLERELAESQHAAAALRARVDELTAMLESATPDLPHRASAETLKGPALSHVLTDAGAASVNSDGAAADGRTAAAVVRAALAAAGGANAAEAEAALARLEAELAVALREADQLRASNASLKKHVDESEATIDQLETAEKEKAVEWEREREALKRKLAQVEREVQDADCRERDACLTMNAMDSILSDALFALQQRPDEPVISSGRP
jgi:chromosome segregation ATPase